MSEESSEGLERWGFHLGHFKVLMISGEFVEIKALETVFRERIDELENHGHPYPSKLKDEMEFKKNCKYCFAKRELKDLYKKIFGKDFKGDGR